ncbi:hypothetical protein, partial, partial [Parasitella parasitica]
FDRGVIKSTSLPLQRICEEYLGHSLQKAAGLRYEGWEDEKLLQEKIGSAALKLFDHFKKNIPISNVPLDANNSISIGQNVALFFSCKNLPVAYGIAEDESIANNNHLPIDQTHASCDLHANSEHVVLTTTKTLADMGSPPFEAIVDIKCLKSLVAKSLELPLTPKFISLLNAEVSPSMPSSSSMPPSSMPSFAMSSSGMPSAMLSPAMPASSSALPAPSSTLPLASAVMPSISSATPSISFATSST